MGSPDRSGAAVAVRQSDTRALTVADIGAIRELLDEAFGGDPDERFDEADWQHALGGMHFIAESDGRVVGHAAVVPRTLWIDGREVRTGYVEAVAAQPARQGQGIGTTLMRETGRHIASAYDLGALGTGAHRFYERLGWQTWRGPSFVRTPEGERRTPDEDGAILVLETPTTPQPFRLDAPIACEWREGDVW